MVVQHNNNHLRFSSSLSNVNAIVTICIGCHITSFQSRTRLIDMRYDVSSLQESLPVLSLLQFYYYWNVPRPPIKSYHILNVVSTITSINVLNIWMGNNAVSIGFRTPLESVIHQPTVQAIYLRTEIRCRDVEKLDGRMSTAVLFWLRLLGNALVLL